MPTRRLHSVSEINVIKQGFILLSDNLKSEGDLFEFPKRKNGTSLFLRQGWYQRVLNNDAQLASCPASDVSAAQTDVKYLSLIQCLWIRRLNINLECSNFSAHYSFFESIDQKICLSLGLRALKDMDIEAPVDNSMPGQGMCNDRRAVMHLGLKIVLFSGAYSYLLKDEKDKKRKKPLPAAFVFEVDTKSFSSTPTKYIAFFFPAITKTSRGPEGEKAVLVVRDFSRDTVPRMITWDIADIELKKDYESQVKKELERDPKSVEKKTKIKNELHDVMEARKLRSEGAGRFTHTNYTKESPSAESLRRLREIYNVRSMAQNVEQLIAKEGEKAYVDQKLSGLKKRSRMTTYGYQTNEAQLRGEAELDAFIQEYGLDALIEGQGADSDDEDDPNDEDSNEKASSSFRTLTLPRTRSFTSSQAESVTYDVAVMSPKLRPAQLSPKRAAPPTLPTEHLEDIHQLGNEAVLSPKWKNGGSLKREERRRKWGLGGTSSAVSHGEVTECSGSGGVHGGGEGGHGDGGPWDEEMEIIEELTLESMERAREFSYIKPNNRKGKRPKASREAEHEKGKSDGSHESVDHDDETKSDGVLVDLRVEEDNLLLDGECVLETVGRRRTTRRKLTSYDSGESPEHSVIKILDNDKCSNNNEVLLDNVVLDEIEHRHETCPASVENDDTEKNDLEETGAKRRSVNERRRKTAEGLEDNREQGEEDEDGVFSLEDSIPTTKEERIKVEDPGEGEGDVEQEGTRCRLVTMQDLGQSECVVALRWMETGKEEEEDNNKMESSTKERRRTGSESGSGEEGCEKKERRQFFGQTSSENGKRSEVSHTDGQKNENEDEDEEKNTTKERGRESRCRRPSEDKSEHEREHECGVEGDVEADKKDAENREENVSRRKSMEKITNENDYAEPKAQQEKETRVVSPAPLSSLEHQSPSPDVVLSHDRNLIAAAPSVLHEKAQQEQETSVVTPAPLSSLEHQSPSPDVVLSHDRNLIAAAPSVLHDAHIPTHDDVSLSSSLPPAASESLLSQTESLESSPPIVPGCTSSLPCPLLESIQEEKSHIEAESFIHDDDDDASDGGGGGEDPATNSAAKKESIHRRALGVIPTPQTLLGVVNARTQNKVVETNDGCPTFGNLTTICSSSSLETDAGQSGTVMHAPHPHPPSKEPIPPLKIPKNPNPNMADVSNKEHEGEDEYDDFRGDEGCDIPEEGERSRVINGPGIRQTPRGGKPILPTPIMLRRIWSSTPRRGSPQHYSEDNNGEASVKSESVGASTDRHHQFMAESPMGMWSNFVGTPYRRAAATIGPAQVEAQLRYGQTMPLDSNASFSPSALSAYSNGAQTPQSSRAQATPSSRPVPSSFAFDGRRLSRRLTTNPVRLNTALPVMAPRITQRPLPATAQVPAAENPEMGARSSIVFGELPKVVLGMPGPLGRSTLVSSNAEKVDEPNPQAPTLLRKQTQPLYVPTPMQKK